MAARPKRERKPNSSPMPVAAVLHWYGENARVLPWRTPPASGVKSTAPDPYRVWLSEIMLQQTTVATVAPRYEAFLRRWPNVGALAAAPLDDVLGEWAGLGYYARARNLHKCAQVVMAEHGGTFPDTEEELRTLPGVGDYTAAAIAAIAFGRRAVVVDGNIERIVARYNAIETVMPAAKREIRACADEIWPNERSGDFAQALMDLAATICRPRNPQCLLCPLADGCAARRAGDMDRYPVKPPKKIKPQRRGAVFALFNGKGEVLIERRPETRMLGSMMGLPDTFWDDKKRPFDSEYAINDAPAATDWRCAGGVEHQFTHFSLSLEVFVAMAPKGFRRGTDQQWIKPSAARLPTVMQKALERAASQNEA